MTSATAEWNTIAPVHVCPHCGERDGEIEAVELPTYESDADGFYETGVEEVVRCGACGCVAVNSDFRAEATR